MALTAGLIMIIINAVLFRSINSNKCSSFEISKDNINKALIGHSVLEVNDKNHHDCARTCMALSVCKSLDFDRNEHVCKLNDVDQSSVDQSEFKTKIGSIFSDISEWFSVSKVSSFINTICTTFGNRNDTFFSFHTFAVYNKIWFCSVCNGNNIFMTYILLCK
jgi:hypothetical protein